MLSDNTIDNNLGHWFSNSTNNHYVSMWTYSTRKTDVNTGWLNYARYSISQCRSVYVLKVWWTQRYSSPSHIVLSRKTSLTDLQGDINDLCIRVHIWPYIRRKISLKWNSFVCRLRCHVWQSGKFTLIMRLLGWGHKRNTMHTLHVMNWLGYKPSINKSINQSINK